ncbi:MAG: hypothetical protein LLG06_11590, partial [Desulfobacteraceae bacterium]|nr:hypothetical protein [Desulfobacteraceae bacterium]
VDAFWYQPWFSENVAQKRLIQPYDRTLTGVAWDWLGTMRPHAGNSLLKAPNRFAHLFTLANKSILNAGDIISLLRAMDTPRSGVFREVAQLMSGCRVESVPGQTPGHAGLIKHVYHLRFKYFDPVLRPLVETFVQHVERVLDCWVSEASVEVRLETVEEQAGGRGAV